jgi:hypothetical protein
MNAAITSVSELASLKAMLKADLRHVNVLRFRDYGKREDDHQCPTEYSHTLLSIRHLCGANSID